MSEWSWASHKSRVVETSLAKLRIGHVGLKSHLFRLNIAASSNCYCGLPETISHYLFQYPLFANARITFYESIKRLNVPMTLTNILGGGDFPVDKQSQILMNTVVYLRATNKLLTL